MSRIFRISNRSLEALEWPSLLEALETRAQSDLGREALLNLRPSSEAPVHRAQGILDLLNFSNSKGLRLPLMDAPDLRRILKRMERKGAILIEEFQKLVIGQHVVSALKNFLEKNFPSSKALATVKESLEPLGAWTHKHEALLDARGGLVDQASPLLGQLRRSHKEHQERIKRRLDDILHSPKYREILQDFYVTLREGRYVLPIKVSFKGRIPGIIHDVSNSDQSVFLEPEEIVEWNNQLKMIEHDIEKEIERILAQVVYDSQSFLPHMMANQELLIEADLMSAVAEFFRETQSPCSVVEDSESLHFEELYHPLLALKQNVVRNDLGFDGALVLTGPNTGGKTVLLKSLGLAWCLAACGMPVPARKAQLSTQSMGLFVDIGDDQDMGANLSTFSGHLTILKEMLEQSQSKDLILIDEIATGTAPEEGQPLAQATLEALVEKNTFVFVTTHYGLLKHYAMSHARARIAAMTFDRKTNRPTYQVLLDIPGESSALETAQNLNFPSQVLDRARALRGEQSNQEWTAALLRLEAQREALNLKNEALEKERLELRRLEDRAQKKQEEYETKQKEGLAQEMKVVLKEFQALREELSQKVRSQPSANLFQKLQETIDKAKTVVREGEMASVPMEELSLMPLKDEQLEKGTLVEVEGLGVGSLVDVPPKPWEERTLFMVQVGELKSRVQRRFLKKPSPSKAQAYGAFQASQKRLEKKRFQWKGDSNNGS